MVSSTKPEVENPLYGKLDDVAKALVKPRPDKKIVAKPNSDKKKLTNIT